MALTRVAASAVVFGTTTVTPATPTGTAVGDAALIFCFSKEPTTPLATSVEGWTILSDAVLGTTVATGIDVGPVRLTVFSNNELTSTTMPAITGPVNATAAILSAQAVSYRHGAGEEIYFQASSRAVATATTTFGGVFPTMNIGAGDELLCFSGGTSDTPSPTAGAATATGMTIGAATTLGNLNSTNGNDGRHALFAYAVTAGTPADVAPSVAITTTQTTNSTGGQILIRPRVRTVSTVPQTTVRAGTGSAGSPDPGTITIPRPAGLGVGDLMLVVHISDNDTGALTTMTNPVGGFLEQDASAGLPSNHPAAKLWRKIAVTADTTATGFGFASSTANIDHCAAMIVIPAGEFDPLDPTTGIYWRDSGTAGATATALPARSISAPPGKLLVNFFATDGGGLPAAGQFTGPSDMTERVEVTSADALPYAAVLIATSAVSTSGPQGIKTATVGAARPWKTGAFFVNASPTAAAPPTSTPITGTDTATQTEAAAVDRFTTAADAETFTEGAPSLASALTVSDSATQTEAPATVAAGQDVTAADSTTLTEGAAAIVVTLAVADTATQTEGVPVLAQTNAVTGTDTATETDTGALAVAQDGTDAAGHTDAAALAAVATDTDTAAQTETAGTLAATLAGSDSATQAELTALSADIGHSDTATLTEQAAALGGYTDVDTATLAELGDLVATAAGSDTATLAETAALSVTSSATDTALLAEQTSLEAGANVAGTDTAALAETATLAATSTPTDAVLASTVQGVSAATNVTAHPITLPPDATDGDRILVLFAADHVVGETHATTSPGWEKIGNTASNGSNVAASLFTKPPGTAVGPLSVTTSGLQQSAHIAARITSSGDLAVLDDNAGATNPPNLAALAPPLGFQRYLWLLGLAIDASAAATQTVTSPTGYDTAIVQNASSTNGAVAALASRLRAAAFEDPTAFTISTLEQWAGFVVAAAPSGAVDGATQTDSASVVELITQTDVTASDTATLGEAADLLAVPPDVADTATLAETVDTVAALAGADASGQAEGAPVISAGISGTDSAALTEQTALAAGAQVTGADSATTTDSAQPPAATLAGGDAGTTADGAELAALLAGTDAATGAPETADLLASSAVGDVATSTESALLDTALSPVSDASAATDAAQLVASYGQTDLAVLEDAATVDVALAVTDVGTLTDAAALAIGTELRDGTDAATLLEGAAVAASVQSSDTLTLTHGASVAGSNTPTGSDAATQSETGATVVRTATVADSASLPSEAGAVAVSLTGADAAALSESANVTIGLESRTADDTAVEADAATLAATLTGADAAAQADLAELAASTAGTDAATLGEAALVDIALERVDVSDVATMAEAASLRVLLSVTDQVGQTVDTVRAWVWAAGTDGGAMVDSAEVVNTTTTAVWPIRAGEPDRLTAVAGGRPYVRDTITTGATRVGAPIRAGAPTRRPWNREE